MKMATHSAQSVKSTMKLYCPKIFVVGAVALTFVCYTHNIAQSADRCRNVRNHWGTAVGERDCC